MLLALAVVFAVFFVLCKLLWLLFRSHSNKGPLISAGVCTLLLIATVVIGTWIGVRMVLRPFEGMIARVKQNPYPIYEQRLYKDTQYPIELPVFDGMDFSNWMSVNNVQFKLGIDTNVFKKSSAKSTAPFLMAALGRQANANATQPFAALQQQLQNLQQQRRLEITADAWTQIDGMPAYQAQGEAYSNQGKINFWFTALQTPQHTNYYLGIFAVANTPTLTEQALAMQQGIRLLPAASVGQ